ncbi:MAG: hypothetical protein EPN36_10940 [Rhodanobacteraceae bacterium]|nr:MAG: hypothetical protein EPN36_10940 [Rhodanobacteraceae bacterium]
MTTELAIALTLVGLVGFYKAGDYEARDGGKSHAILWAGLSTLVSGIVFAVLEGGWLSWLFGQAMLFVGIGAVRVWLEDRANK